MQLGTQAGEESIAVALNVAISLMQRKGITPKFSTSEFRDNIPPGRGVKSQSRVFNKLDKDLTWTGAVISIKVPVVQLKVFAHDTATKLAKCKSLNCYLQQ